MYEQFKSILVDELSIDPELITMDAELTGDLGINSLELADLILLCEEKFDIEINDEDKTCSLQVSSIPCESGPKRHIDVMEMYNKIYDMKRWDK